MISARQVSSALQVPVIESSAMTEKINTWKEMYLNESSWNSKRIVSLGLPTSIASEFARLTLCEMKTEINNNFLNSQFQRLVSNIFSVTEIASAMGGVLLKPYVSNNEILTDIVRPTSFFPVAFNYDYITAIICPQQIVQGSDCYTRLEYHEYNQQKKTYLITNECYLSHSSNDLGTKCDLSNVSQWSGLAKRKILENVERPLFAYFKMPFSNNIDMNSPLGLSVYSKSANLIRQADEQWERILWEYESSERAIDASEDLFIKENDMIKFPKGRERLFRLYEPRVDGSAIIDTFSPNIRDESMFNGLNRILQRIEFSCGLAYGTISDISNVEKTAEEIKTSKQRSYAQISAIQNSLKNTLEHLTYIYEYYGNYFKLTTGNANLTCTFGDSVLEDTEKEYQRRLQMVTAQLLSKEKFIAWYFGCSEEEAKAYIPATSDLFGGGT